MLKLYAWQENFLQRIYRRRARELGSLRSMNLLSALGISAMYFFPNLLPTATFSVYVASGDTLRYSTAVASLIIFNLMQEPLLVVPSVVDTFIEVVNSLKRIEKFLDTEEVQKGLVEQGTPEDEVALRVSGSFSWGFSAAEKKSEGEEEKKGEAGDEEDKNDETEETATLGKFMTLKNIDLEVKRGEFVCIIGDTGSGKSSLLSAVIGDMIYVPDAEIQAFGGLDKQGDKDSFDQLR